jgi:hypothetical protein
MASLGLQDGVKIVLERILAGFEFRGMWADQIRAALEGALKPSTRSFLAAGLDYLTTLSTAVTMLNTK